MNPLPKGPKITKQDTDTELLQLPSGNRHDTHTYTNHDDDDDDEEEESLFQVTQQRHHLQEIRHVLFLEHGNYEVMK